MEKYSGKAIPEGYMRIGEMAKKAGITVRTLSYYDKEGLLPTLTKSEGGYRLYTDKDMVKLIQILMMKQLGLPLSEIKKRITQLDTPEDVRKMLTEQAAQVRNKIGILTESLDAMEALNTEIAQMETVNFKKYADILLNLQVKNESYRMIKHFDDEILDMFRERIGWEKTALIAATLHDLYKDAVELVKRAVPPENEKGQAFAKQLWETLIELSDGDIDMMFKLQELMDKASSIEDDNNEERMSIRHYMNQALEGYHISICIGTDKTAALLNYGMYSHNKAYMLYKEGAAPESEEAQKFIKTFWETMLELTNGNIDIITQLSEYAKKMESQSEKIAISRRFTEAALEIYFSNQGKGSKGD